MKQTLQTLVLLIFVYGVVEAISFGFFFMATGKSFSQESLEQLMPSSESSAKNAVQNQPGKLDTAIHPYLGFVYDPETWNNLMTHDGLKVNQFGLIDDKSPIQRKDPKKLIVGVFGGSVAWWFSKQGGDELVAELKKNPAYEDKEVVIVRAALGGFKQPQQLNALTYFLTQGAEFDIVINFDGFNEINAPVSNNMLKHVHPFYPQNWFLMTEKLPQEDIQRAIGKISYINESRKSRADWLLSSALRYSPLAATLWSISDSNLANDIGKARIELQNVEVEEDKAGFVTSGPPYRKAGVSAMPDLVSMWERSSLLMHQLAKANRIRYFHYLQPNQYVKDSKVLTAEELKIGHSKFAMENETVAAGYPLLKKRGEALKRRGVHFVDLSDSFKDVSESLYIDTCCHLNEKGSSILGRIVGKDIAES